METKMIRGRETTRDEAVLENMGLVKMVASSLGIVGKKAGFEFEDLVGIGTIGLIEAYDRFDASKGNEFSTFAGAYIRGTIMNSLRQTSGIGPRYSNNVMQLASKVRKEGMVDAETSEICKAFDVTQYIAEAVQSFLKRDKNILWLDKQTELNEAEDYYDLIGEAEDDTKLMMIDFMDRLTDPEKVVLRLLLNEYNGVEIGNMLGRSRAYGKVVRDRIKKKLEIYLREPEEAPQQPVRKKMAISL